MNPEFFSACRPVHLCRHHQRQPPVSPHPFLPLLPLHFNHTKQLFTGHIWHGLSLPLYRSANICVCAHACTHVRSMRNSRRDAIWTLEEYLGNYNTQRKLQGDEDEQKKEKNDWKLEAKYWREIIQIDTWDVNNCRAVINIEDHRVGERCCSALNLALNLYAGLPLHILFVLCGLTFKTVIKINRAFCLVASQ